MKRALFISLTIFPLWSFAADKKAEAAPATEAATPAPVSEFTCEASVSFTWKANPPEIKESKGPANKEPVEAPKEQEEYFNRIELTGDNKAEVERQLKARLKGEEGRAKAYCVDQHQNTGGCIAARLATLGASYREYDFETRRSLRKRFAEDCARATGICMGTSATEVKCVEKVTAPPAAPADAAPAEEKKKK